MNWLTFRTSSHHPTATAKVPVVPTASNVPSPSAFNANHPTSTWALLNSLGVNTGATACTLCDAEVGVVAASAFSLASFRRLYHIEPPIPPRKAMPEAIIVEKHWRGLISRQIVDYFNDQVAKFLASSTLSTGASAVSYANGEAASATPVAPKKEAFTFTPEDVPPVIETTKYLLMNVYRGGLTWLCPVEKEALPFQPLVDPLLVFEFIHRIIDILTDYLGDVSESTIRENFVTVYQISLIMHRDAHTILSPSFTQLLEEMMDYGYPLTTEPNALKEMIMPPTIINKVMNTVAAASGVAPKLPHGTLSSFPWRKAGVKYTNNEIYFDIVEEIDAIVDRWAAVYFRVVSVTQKRGKGFR
ncbi:Longin-like domain-containing protein [Jimgerdemannia flammicorona]|uniref:Longin-like domain-containing protein n=1 Tax=Jimgerdemannia flammicorona TaxID=994334 RepID=A0A433D5T3_9FUNG|nr:Longin-like domain-containing protein [Jimgerdemannia flammicorona]